MTLLYFLIWKIPFNRLIWYSYFLSLYIYYSHAFCFCNIYLFGKKAHNEISKIIFSIVSKHPSTFFHDLKNILKWNLLIFNFFPFEMLMTMSHIIFYKSDKKSFSINNSNIFCSCFSITEISIFLWFTRNKLLNIGLHKRRNLNDVRCETRTKI